MKHIVYALLFVVMGYALSTALAVADVQAGLVGHWTFDEGSGTVAYDSSTSANSVQLQSGAGWAPGKLGTALSLDGVDDFAVLTSKIFLAPTYTYAAWVNLRYTSGNAWQPILSHDTGGYARWIIHPGERFRIQVGGFSCSYSSPFQVPPNEWAHIVTVFDGSRFLTYVNGNGPTIGNNCPPSQQTFLKYIGRAENQYSTTKFKGLIDDLRIFNRALTAEDVQLLFSGGLPPQADNLNLQQQNMTTEILAHASSYDPFWVPSFMRGPINGTTTAQALRGVDLSHLVSDATCFGGYGGFCTADEPALRVGLNGVRIPLHFSNLVRGIYTVRLIGRANAPMFRIEKPIYVHLRINDRADGAFNEYRMRVLYPASTIEDIGRFSFYAPHHKNTLDGELFVGPGSQGELLVHRVEFYNGLGAAEVKSIKRTPGTFTSVERLLARQWAKDISAKSRYDRDESGKAYGDYDVWRWINNGLSGLGLRPTMTPAERQARDDLLWGMFPPLNSMYQGYGSFDSGAYPNGMTKAAAEAQYGVWEIDRTGASPDRTAYDYPFKLVNRTLNIRYSLDDLVNRRPLPDPYPFKDDGRGYDFSANVWSSPGTSLYPIAPLVTEKMLAYTSAFSTSSNGGGARLAEIYHYTGNRDAAWDGAIMLVRLALQWPGIQMETADVGLNTANPDLTYNSFTRWNFLGKINYSGWSGPLADEIALAYDRLFDFIKDNQTFADAVHRYVPWVTTPTDVIALLDSHLIQGTVNDVKVGRTRQFNPILHGLVLGPSSIGNELLDLSKAEIDIYPLGVKPIKVHYGNSLNRDGTHYIGSTFYASGTPEKFIDMAAGLERYRAMGGNPPHLLGNFSSFPKVRAAAGFLFDRWVAGGYDYQVGDVGGPYTPRFRIPFTSEYVRKIWKVAHEPRAAWMIAHVYGRRGDSDAEWAAITQAAAQTNDPRLRMTSRVLGGFGAAIMESGAHQNDYRKKTAVAFRTGSGVGHSHSDALDLSFYSLGLQMATDYGQRNEGDLFTLPPDHTSYTHNVVEVDGKLHPWKASGDWPPGSFTRAEAWVEQFVPEPGSQYVSASGISASHPTVQVFRRDGALIDIGDPEVSSEAYVFDVFRVRGGKWHTWSFHGADTSGEPDGFTVNVPLESVTPNDGSITATYLRKHSDSSKRHGVASAKVEATWRVGRSAGTFTNLCNQDMSCLDVTTNAAEQMMYQTDYDAASPRKFTKVTLFGRTGDTVMTGNLFSKSYKMNIPNLYVQSRQEGDSYAAIAEKDNLYPAVIEAYAGTSSLTTDQLDVEPNELGALGAAALRVRHSTGQEDILYSDGVGVTTRVIKGGQLTVQGAFGHYSTQGGIFRFAHLIGGKALDGPTVGITLPEERYVTTIVRVDYRTMRLTVAPSLPPNLKAGEEFLISNADHKTSYHLTKPAGLHGNELAFDKDPLIGDLEVRQIAGSTVTTDMDYILSDTANRTKGYTATNERRTKSWKLQKTGYATYTLTGSTVTLDDFTDEDGDGRVSMLVFDFGPGDTLEVPTHGSVRAKGVGVYEIRANAPLTLSVPGLLPMNVQNSNGAWLPVAAQQDGGRVTGEIPLSALITGRALVRVKPMPDGAQPVVPRKLRMIVSGQPPTSFP